MFMKVIQNKVETTYEVAKVSCWKSGSGAEDSSEEILCIDYTPYAMESSGIELRLNIEGEAQVYLLNNSGKTIDKIS